MNSIILKIKDILGLGVKDPSKVKTNPLTQRNVQLVLAIVIFFGIMVINRPDTFLSSTNIKSMLIQISDVGIFALAMALTMIAGGIDLSIVSLANLVAVINAVLLKAVITDTTSNSAIWLWLLVCLAIALIVGFIGGVINSFLIANLGIPQILATMATMNLYLGVSTIITGGRGIIGFPQQLLNIGSGDFLGIPYPFIIFLLFAVIMYIFLQRTPYGTKLRLYGLNQRATFFSGINNKKVIYQTHILACMTAAVMGLLIMARTNSATVDYGGQVIVTTLLIGILSGVAALSGVGNAISIILALFLNQLINSGLNLLRVSSFIREMVPAALLITIISLEFVLYRTRERRLNRMALKLNLEKANNQGAVNE